MYLNFIKNDLKVTPTFMGIFDSGGLSDNSVFWEVTSMRGMRAAARETGLQHHINE
jgi:hypothetical protein